ncbi:unannotated protein [freshwater metagenome]|uniref:Unannotated protein n=1 Tax=freshwater metagenome TaxID=449393 RepID=A0A6J7DFZ6_9ZZZZ
MSYHEAMRVVRLLALSLCITGFTTTAALAGTPPRGTAKQVATAVANSPKIVKLTPKLLAALPAASKDTVSRIYPVSTNPGCDTTRRCVFGSTTSKTTVVLFGDSHASQWLPALAPIALENHFKLIVIWHASCHVANVNVQYEPLGYQDFDFCNTWLPRQIAAIKKLRPKLVLLGERTAQIGDAKQKPFTSTAWRDGLVSTITRLKTSTTQVAILEDLPWSDMNPGPCLSLNVKNVQSCGNSYTKPAFKGQQVAERNAARLTRAGFIPTHQWFCTKKTCSPVVGDYITKWDPGHASATYVQYLTAVIATALKPLL